MKNHVFIDLGANKGLSIDWCKKYYGRNYLIYAFEPNPNLYRNLLLKYSNQMTIIINHAVWIRNEKKEFRVAKNDISSTFYRHVNNKNVISVQAIDFSRWIKDTMTEGDFIVIKMNIEGAEFQVLSKMIEDRTINMVGRLYYQFHPNMKPKPARNLARNLISTIESRGVICQKWIGSKQTERL